MHFRIFLSVDNIPATNNDRKKFAKQICEKVDVMLEPFEYDTDNPNELYDYYVIGASTLFLVRENCEEYFVDETTKDVREAPDGYLWVAAARKKDIAWKKMYDFETQAAKNRYLAYVKYYNTGEADEELQSSQFVLCDKGIKNGYAYRPDENFFYYRGETMEEYLQRIGYLPESKYPIFAGFIQNGVYHDIDDIEADTEQEETMIWLKQVEEYISELSEEAVLVVVNCHG